MNIRRLIAIMVILITLLSSAINVIADNSSVSVLVNTEIKFTVNGEGFIPREPDGTRVYPLTYNDRTYIPARFIAERIGLEVSWDEATQTVGFTKSNNAQNTNEFEIQDNIPQKFYDDVIINQAIRFEFDGIEFIPKEVDGSRVYPLSYKDRTYIPARFIAEKAGIIVTWDENTQTVGLLTKDYVADHEGQIPDLPGTETDTPNVPEGNPELPSQPETPNAYAADYKALRDKIESMRVEYMGDDSWYESKQKTIETKLALIPYLGVETVNYAEVMQRMENSDLYKNNSYKVYKDSVQYYYPSYADLYIYYTKNNSNKSDKEILAHLNQVYSLNINDAVQLVPLNQSETYKRYSVGLPVEVPDESYESYDLLGISSMYTDIPGNGKTFQFQHMGWAGEFLRNEYVAGINDAIFSDRIFTKFAFSLNSLMSGYETYLEYYLSQHAHPNDFYFGKYTDSYSQMQYYALDPFRIITNNTISDLVFEMYPLTNSLGYLYETEINEPHWKVFDNSNKSVKERVYEYWPH